MGPLLFSSTWTSSQQLVQKAAQICRLYYFLSKTSWSPDNEWTVVPSKLCIWHKWVTREDPHVPSSRFYPVCTAQEPGHWCCRSGWVPAPGRGTGSTSTDRQTPGHWRGSCPWGWSCCAQSMPMDMALSLPSFMYSSILYLLLFPLQIFLQQMRRCAERPAVFPDEVVPCLLKSSSGKWAQPPFSVCFFKLGVHLPRCCLLWLLIEIVCFAEIMMKDEIFVSTHALIDVLGIYFGSAKLIWSRHHYYIWRWKVTATSVKRNYTLSSKCISMLQFTSGCQKKGKETALKWITESHLASHQKKKKKSVYDVALQKNTLRIRKTIKKGRLWGRFLKNSKDKGCKSRHSSTW